MESKTTEFENKTVTVGELIAVLSLFDMDDEVSISHEDTMGCYYIDSVLDNKDFDNDNSMAIIHFNLKNEM